MTVKCSGAEYKRFFNDDAYWGVCASHRGVSAIGYQDAEVLVDGVDVTYNDVDKIADGAVVEICGGFVVDGLKCEDLGSLESFFKKWRKKQNTATLIVECDLAKIDAMKAAVKAAGGKVVK